MKQVLACQTAPDSANKSASLKSQLVCQLVLFSTLASSAIAHPLPDVPLRSFFEADGSAVIKIEVDTRCFSKDPEAEPYLRLDQYLRMAQVERDQLRSEALTYVRRAVEFTLNPGGVVQPDWVFEFTTFQSHQFSRANDPVMLTGSWNLEPLAGLKSYQVRALPGGNLSVLFLNYYQQKILSGIQVLFPGESSHVLNIASLTDAETGDPDRDLIEGIHSFKNSETFFSFIRAGFVHVVPLGFDHILFVLGLFLLSLRWKTLLWQVSTVTTAHTITLGLATTGFLNVPSFIVEPIIAGSIVVIAFENIFNPKYSSRRLLIVFIFGLIHGLGFAGALSKLGLPPTSMLISLLGFNVGVEGGQLTVIILAYIATMFFRHSDQYRQFVVLPGSISIAVIGAYWMIERIF